MNKKKSYSFKCHVIKRFHFTVKIYKIIINQLKDLWNYGVKNNTHIFSWITKNVFFYVLKSSALRVCALPCTILTTTFSSKETFN